MSDVIQPRAARAQRRMALFLVAASALAALCVAVNAEGASAAPPAPSPHMRALAVPSVTVVSTILPSPTATAPTVTPTVTATATAPAVTPTAVATATPTAPKATPKPTAAPPANTNSNGSSNNNAGSNNGYVPTSSGGSQPTKVVFAQPTYAAGDDGASGFSPTAVATNGLLLATTVGCGTALLGIIIAAISLVVLVRGGYGPFLRSLLPGKRRQSRRRKKDGANGADEPFGTRRHAKRDADGGFAAPGDAYAAYDSLDENAYRFPDDVADEAYGVAAWESREAPVARGPQARVVAARHARGARSRSAAHRAGW